MHRGSLSYKICIPQQVYDIIMLLAETFECTIVSYELQSENFYLVKHPKFILFCSWMCEPYLSVKIFFSEDLTERLMIMYLFIFYWNQVIKSK